MSTWHRAQTAVLPPGSTLPRPMRDAAVEFHDRACEPDATTEGEVIVLGQWVNLC